MPSRWRSRSAWPGPVAVVRRLDRSALLALVATLSLCLAVAAPRPGGSVEAVAPSALAFNGTTALVSVPDSAGLRVTTNLTLEAWIKPTSAPGWRDVVGKNNYELAVQPDGAGFDAVFALSTN